MNDEYDLSMSELRQRRSRRENRTDGNGSRAHDNPRREGWANRTKVIGTGTPSTETTPRSEGRSKPYDPWRLLDALTKRWFLILAAAAALGAFGAMAGFWMTDYAVRVQLFRRQTPNVFAGGNDAFQPRELSTQTLFDMMRSAEVLRRVSEKAHPPITMEKLGQSVKILPDRNADYAWLEVSGTKNKQALVSWANLCATEVAAYTKEIQSNEAADINHWLKQKLAAAESDLESASERLNQFARSIEVLDFEKEIESYLTHRHSVDLKFETARIELESLGFRRRALQLELGKQNPVTDKVKSAEDELETLLINYNDAHPLVQIQREKLTRLRRQAAAAGTNAPPTTFAANSLASALHLQLIELDSQQESLKKQLQQYDTMRTNVHTRIKELSGKAADYALLKGRRQEMEIKRSLYANRQREAQLLQENALGYYRVYAPATLAQVSARKRFLAVGFLTFTGVAVGFFITVGLILLTEVMDSRLKTAADVQRVTKLPILATLGDLRRMSPADQVHWAFRTLTLLHGKLNASADQSLVCGFISSGHGEGRSTWINLLVNAASQRGLRVLTVATRPSTTPGEMPEDLSRPSSLLPVGPTTTLNANVLAFPAQVSEQFSENQPVVHIPLPGWVWNLERRKQWQSALDHWRKIENMVLLIELPPASQPEAVLLAENIPQVIWLTSSGMAKAEETRRELETLRHARCNVVGAVLNREPSSFWKNHFSGWVQRFSILLALGFVELQAAETNRAQAQAQAETVATHASLTAARPMKRAPWQERLTLGPGDSLDFTLFGYPELTRTNLVIGPDGRLSFAQIQDFPAAGLTVDELRAKLNMEFERYGYRNPRTIVTPVSFQSKKYYMLGKVVTKGVFTLDRPLTVVEAVARARGLETGWMERNQVETADLAHSFLVRQGKRVPIDFERLFQQGDLSQNIQLEPNDYLYFPSANVSEIYVLGEVFNPGVSSFAPNTTLIAALSARGGFSPRAYKKKILVVRGSLSQPETFVVDAAAVLEGMIPDFKLQAKDIVYVSARPWIKIEELLDLAGEAFVQAAVTTWVGGNVGPVISRPIVPDL